MKVVIAAGGRFHAVRLAQELYARKALYRFVSGSYTKADQTNIPPAQVDSIISSKIIDQIIWRTRLASIIRPSTLYVAKDAWFDNRLKAAIKKLEPFDIFVGWAHYFLESLSEIRKKAKIVIVESGSCHIEEHERLIVDQCRELNLPTNNLSPANRNKILAEYAASDYIMTPSTFARASFLRKGFAPEKILQIPCGMDIDFFTNNSRAFQKEDGSRLGGRDDRLEGISSMDTGSPRSQSGAGSGRDDKDEKAHPFCHPGPRAGIQRNFLSEFGKRLNPQDRPVNFFRLLFVGQLQIGKGIHTLLEAWRNLRLDTTKAELLLVGNLQKDVRLLLERYPLPAGVRIIPGVSRIELKKLYDSAHAFVLPSIQDGFGMVLGEAMASGLPVIASMNTGAPDIFRSKDDGVLVPAGDIEALADAISQLYQNKELRIALAASGIECIKDFTWQRYGDSTFRMYEELLGNKELVAARNPSTSSGRAVAFPAKLKACEEI
jgi:glycosyltransferase involved in cell wall biosynthesis